MNDICEIPAGFKETEIGMIPLEWKVVKLNNAFKFSRKPKNLDITKYDQIPFIPMEYIPDDGIYVNKYNLKRSANIKSGTFFLKGDLLLAKITPSFENGKQCIVKNLPTNFGYATTEVWPIHEIDEENKARMLYLFYYLKKKDIRNDIAARMEGSTGRQRIHKSVLENFKIPLPPISEQKQIAYVLSTVQDSIEKTEAVIQASKELKKSLLKYLFTYGPVTIQEKENVILKETEIGMIPEDWDIVTLKKVCSPRKKFIKPNLAKNLIYVGLKHIIPEELEILKYGNPQDVKSTKFLFLEGDVLYGKLRPYLNKVAIACDDGICSTDILVFKVFNKKIFNTFFANYLQTEFFISFATMTMSGVNHPRTSWNKLKDFFIPTPSFSEQKQITNILSSINEKIQTEQNKKTGLQQLFNTLLNNLMTGKIRVNHLEVPDA